MIGDQLLHELAGVGAVTSSDARFWVRAERPGPVELELASGAGGARARFVVPDERAADFTTSVSYPEDLPGAHGLSPATTYDWAIRSADRALLGEGRFETAPRSAEEAPDQLAIAFMSCHQPFDPEGSLRPERLRMLRAAERAFEEHRVVRVLMLGDQVYSDYPKCCSLFDDAYFRTVAPRGCPTIFDCSASDVRRLYHQRYRAFWSMPELQRIIQRWPTSMMIDDHDLAENFGTPLEHAGSLGRSVREGALAAALDYQFLRTSSRRANRRSFHFRLELGPLAAFVMDLRSRRGWFEGRYQIFDEEQFRDLTSFLRDNQQRPLVVIGLSVPLVHVPEWIPRVATRLLSAASDVEDRWEAISALPHRDRLLGLLYQHQKRCPEQRLILISGDIHVGLANRIEWEDRSCPPCHQLVSSAVSNIELPIVQMAAAAVSRMRQRLTSDRIIGADIELIARPGMKNPYDRLNIGLVKVTREHGAWKARLLLLGHDDADPPRARVVFESEPF